MKTLSALVGAITATIGLAGCGQSREGGELRLKHIVTVMTSEGARSFSSVVSMIGFQSYNYHAGNAGWGGISCRLTGDAVRVVAGDREFYFLLTRPGHATPAWNQIDLIKAHFGLPNYTTDAGWITQWKALAQSSRHVDLSPEDYPAVAMMPRDGWMNDARLLSLTKAQAHGLRVLRYRLEITRDAVGAQPPLAVRYRRTEGGPPGAEIERKLFSEVNGRA